MAENPAADSERTVSNLDQLLKFVQSISVVAGVVVSTWTVSHAIQMDAVARKAEADKRSLELQQFDHRRQMDVVTKAREAALPFLKLRMEKYLDAVKVAGVLADKNLHTADEYQVAVKRFWELYWAELSMVETKDVEAMMVGVKQEIAPDHKKTELQTAILALAQSIRQSTARSWGIEELESPVQPPAADRITSPSKQTR